MWKAANSHLLLVDSVVQVTLGSQLPIYEQNYIFSQHPLVYLYATYNPEDKYFF